jgi:hypothetical protein
MLWWQYTNEFKDKCKAVISSYMQGDYGISFWAGAWELGPFVKSRWFCAKKSGTVGLFSCQATQILSDKSGRAL